MSILSTFTPCCSVSIVNFEYVITGWTIVCNTDSAQ